MHATPKKIGSPGGMKLPSYADSKKIEEDSIPLWIQYFQNLDTVAKAYFVDDKETQTKDHWDIMVIPKGSLAPLRIDVKTRSGGFYLLYQRDNMILIEIKGNTSNSSQGSSIFNSNAEAWGYGWVVNNELKEPLIFYRKLFAEWLYKYGIENFDSPPNTNTDNLYETKNILVPRKYFKPFEISHLTKEIVNA